MATGGNSFTTCRLAVVHLFIALLIFAEHVTEAASNSTAQTRSAAIGQTVTLPCSVDSATAASEPNFLLSWLSPREELLTMNYTRLSVDDRFSVAVGYVRERNLRIGNIRVEDAGTYRCKLASNNRVIGEISLIVNVPPRISYHSSDVTAKLDSDVELTCSATGSPQPEITWYKADNVDNVLWRGEKLVLKSVTRDQVGWYTCVADNNVSPGARETIKVDVNFGPELQLPYRELRQNAGSDALLTCLVQSHPAPSDVFWHRYRDGLRLQNVTGKYLLQSWPVGDTAALFTAYVSALEEADFGAYRCVAKNDLASAEAIIVIHELNNTGPPILANIDDCLSTMSADSTLAALVAVATLLAVAMVALGIALYALWRTRRQLLTLVSAEAKEQPDNQKNSVYCSLTPGNKAATRQKPTRAEVTGTTAIHLGRSPD